MALIKSVTAVTENVNSSPAGGFVLISGGMSSVSQCCREMRFIETKPKILIKKGFVFSVTNASIFACPNRAPIPGWSQSPRADEIGLREVTLALSPWAVESEKGLRASQVGTD